MRVEQLSLFDTPPVPAVSTVCLSVGDFAKLLKSRGFDIGEKRLFAKMRELKLLDQRNVPFQRFMQQGYFKIIRQQYKRDAVSHVYLKPLVTPARQRYIEDMLRNENACYRA